MNPSGPGDLPDWMEKKVALTSASIGYWAEYLDWSTYLF